MGLLASLQVASYGQCTVSMDPQKRVITVCQTYNSSNGLLMNRTDNKATISQAVFLGSEYLTYPIWQNGSLELGSTQKSIPCRIAYNLITNQVVCQFPGDSVIHLVSPDAFTINDMHFVSRLNQRAERTYYRVLYAGKTRLLAQYKCTLRHTEKEPYMLDQSFDGTYQRKKSFYVQRGNDSVTQVQLSRKSLLKVLNDSSGKLPAYLTNKTLTIRELVAAVAYYDGFM